MKGSGYTLCFAAILGVVCSLLLTAAASFTAPYKAANAEAEEMLNILIALKVPIDASMSSEQLVEVFDRNVRKEKHGNVELYIYANPEQGGKTEAVAVPFAGPGLWGPIKGFLALEPDMRTIRGISFHEQEETPGLGGEITSEWFRQRFVGKSIVGASGKAGIVINGSGSNARNQIDAISGATMTCDKVESMLNKVIESIVEEDK